VARPANLRVPGSGPPRETLYICPIPDCGKRIRSAVVPTCPKHHCLMKEQRSEGGFA
jgi:hypothetical protein